MSGAQFDEIFNNIFNLNKYSLLHKNAKAEAKRLSDDIKTNSIKLDILKSNIKNYDSPKERENITTLEAVLLEKGKVLDEFSNKIADIDSSLLSLKASGTTKTKESLQEDILEYDAVLQQYSGDLQKLVKTEDKIFAEYENTKILHKKDLTRGPDPCYNIKQTVEEIQEILISQESSKKKVEFDANITNDYIKAKKYLKSIELDNNTLNLEDLSKTITALEWCAEKDSYLLPKNLKEKITDDLTKTYIDPALLLKYKKIVEDKEKRDENVAYNIKIDQNISKYKKLLSDRKIQDAYNVKNRLKELVELMDYIDTYHDKNDALTELKAIKDNTRVNDLLKEKKLLMKNLEQTREEIKSCEFDLHTAKKDLEMFEKTQADINKISPKLQLITKQAEILKIYVEITHQKNLPKRIISNVIKNITDDANGLIYNTTGLLCEIQENDKWEVVVKKGDLILGPEHCSGYERFILNTSLKISFDKFKQLSSIKLFMIDETIDCVSESNLDQIDVLLECLHKHYGKVILISHNEDLKKKINNRIGIHIDGKISTII
jgi:DNA repair exonuclease SbcCD ATPase subunit